MGISRDSTSLEVMRKTSAQAEVLECSIVVMVGQIIWGESAGKREKGPRNRG